MRLGRKNCRIDEGINEVALVNAEEVVEEYGQMITVLDCINDGEAFIVVRNNVDKALSLPAGMLKLSITPTITLPVCRSSSVEFQELKKAKDEGIVELADLKTLPEEMANLTSVGGDEKQERERNPRTFYNWNCRSLPSRVRNRELGRFYDTVAMQMPDIISLQEVKLVGDENDRSKVCEGTEDEEILQEFIAPLEDNYVAYMTLSEKKYGGQILLVRKDMAQPVMSYNFGKGSWNVSKWEIYESNVRRNSTGVCVYAF